jgi:fumarate hydratase class II
VHFGELALGGTAVGTGLNTHPELRDEPSRGLADEMHLPAARGGAIILKRKSGRDTCVEASGALKTIAVSLIKIANDIRWLASGPRLGLGEIKLLQRNPAHRSCRGK